jgi:adenylyltransferase/sulfurtransferase
VSQYDVIVDGTDNFATRYLVNDACVLSGRPNVHASVFQFDGQASVFATEQGPCYRCLYPEPPPPGLVQNCAEGGVLGVLPGLLGTIQAVETLKLLLGIGETLAGRLLMVDALSMAFRTIVLERDPACPACGTRTLTTLIDYDQFCGTAPLGESPTESVREISVPEAKRWLASATPPRVLDVREAHEVVTGMIPGAVHLPLGQVRAEAGGLATDRPWLVVCRSGKRSAEAVRILAAAGLSEASSLAGGMLAWEAAG